MSKRTKNGIGVFVIIAFAAILVFASIVIADGVGRDGYTDIKYTYFYSLTGTAPYVRWINKQQGLVYDLAADELSATPTWTDTDISLTTKMTSVGGWLVPSTLPPDGVYDLLLYDVDTAAGSRANTDEVTRGKHVKIEDGVITKMFDI